MIGADNPQGRTTWRFKMKYRLEKVQSLGDEFGGNGEFDADDDTGAIQQVKSWRARGGPDAEVRQSLLRKEGDSFVHVRDFFPGQ